MNATAVMAAMQALIDEIYIAAMDCGYRSCSACKFNFKCADAMEAALTQMKKKQ